MIAYRRRLLFSDEAALQHASHAAAGADTVEVRRCTGPSTATGEAGSWQVLSGQAVRFYALASGGTRQVCALEIRDCVMLSWCTQRSLIRYRPLADYTPVKLRFWVLHTVLPLLLTQMGQMEVLHVGAVAAGERALVFSAPSMGGKSTLTAYCLERGHALLSDDGLGVVLRDDACRAVPGHGYIRPWRETGSLGRPASRVAAECVQLDRMYALRLAPEDARVRPRELHGTNKFQTLAQARLVQLPELAARQFASLGALASRVRVFEVCVPRHLDRLPEVYETLLRHGHFDSGLVP